MKMALLISRKNLDELACTGEGEVGYLFLFRPSNESNLYSIARMPVEGRAVPSLPNTAVEGKVMKYLFTNPDVIGVPYKNIMDVEDGRTNFYCATKIFRTTDKFLNLFLEIAGKDLKFFELVEKYGSISESPRIGYSLTLKDIAAEDRAREILVDILSLGNPRPI